MNQDRLLLAARARIARMMKPKVKRTDLVPPKYVRDHFESGHKKQLAQMLVDCNFDKVPRCTKKPVLYTVVPYAVFPRHTKAIFFNKVEKIVLKRDEQVVEKEQGWYSEAEMKNDLSWSQPHP